jgi:hypothetical protein
MIQKKKVGGRDRDRTGDPLLAKQTGENTKGFVWCRLHGKLAKFLLSQMSRSCTELFQASELPNAVSCRSAIGNLPAIVPSGRSNLCPSHDSLNSLSDFDGSQSVIYHGIYRKEVI